VRKRLQDVAVDGEHDHRYRLADLLGFHDREAKPQWWEFFDRQDRFEDEWIDDNECLAALESTGDPMPVKKSLLHTFRFPPQDTRRRAGDAVVNVATGHYAGTIEQLDEARLQVKIKVGLKNGPLPQRLSVGPGGPIDNEILREAIYRVAQATLDGNGRYRAIRDILCKAAPRLKGRKSGQALADGSDLLNATTKAVFALDHSYF